MSTSSFCDSTCGIGGEAGEEGCIGGNVHVLAVDAPWVATRLKSALNASLVMVTDTYCVAARDISIMCARTRLLLMLHGTCYYHVIGNRADWTMCPFRSRSLSQRKPTNGPPRRSLEMNSCTFSPQTMP